MRHDRLDDTQRAVGAVLGSAVGDALGAQFEFGPPGQYSARLPEPVFGGVGEMVGGGGIGWAPGEFTDDTQMAIVQAESILDRGGVDGADLFERFRVWASRAADVGVQTSAALRSGLPWDEAAAAHFARNPRSGGNGSLTRSTPTAVRYASASVDETIAIARSSSAITHGEAAAGWRAALCHVMMRAELRGDDAFVAFGEQLDQLPPDQDRYRRMLAPEWTPDHMEVPNGSVWGCLAQAVWAVRTTTTFAGAVIAAIERRHRHGRCCGRRAGRRRYGVQAIPSRWTTYVHGHVTTPEGRRAYDSAALQELTSRLLGKELREMEPPGPGVGPTEIAPHLFAADLAAAAATPPETAIISLCRTAGRLDDHPVRRSVFLIDQVGSNPSLDLLLDDVLATIDEFLDEGRDVIVHCHHGQSRTGFVLRAWLMHHHGWDEPTATQHVADRWPHSATTTTTSPPRSSVADPSVGSNLSPSWGWGRWCRRSSRGRR